VEQARQPSTRRLLRTVPAPLLLGFGALMVFLPTLGVSFVIYLVVERLIRTFAGPGDNRG
jgi:hypothetical protein